MSTKTQFKYLAILTAMLSFVSIQLDYYLMGIINILLYIYQMHLYNTTKG